MLNPADLSCIRFLGSQDILQHVFRKASPAVLSHSVVKLTYLTTTRSLFMIMPAILNRMECLPNVDLATWTCEVVDGPDITATSKIYGNQPFLLPSQIHIQLRGSC